MHVMDATFPNTALFFCLQMVLHDWSTLQLKLADVEQQQQAIKDLLQRQLIQAAVEEHHGAPGSKWFSNSAGTTANYVLTNSSHTSNPLHALVVIALLLRCYVRVRMPEPEHAAAASVERAKRPRVAKQYLFVTPPAPQSKPQQQQQQEEEEEVVQGTSSGCGTSRDKMLIQLTLRHVPSEGVNKWLFDVVSSTRLSKQRLAAQLGRSDDEYESCMKCGQVTHDTELVCSDGIHCTTALHFGCLSPQQQQETAQPKWLCATCVMRGRSVNNPEHLKQTPALKLT